MKEYIIFPILLGLFLSGAGITYLIYRFIRIKQVKYVPSIITFVIAFYFFYNTYFVEAEGMLSLANFLSFMLFFAMFVGSISASLYLEFKRK